MNLEEKEYRTKLYQENKEQYKKMKKQFVYGVSQNFRNKRKNRRSELEHFVEETMQIEQEEYQYGR